MGIFFRDWRRIACASLLLTTAILTGLWFRSDRQIQYLFHYNLSDAEITVLPNDIAVLARTIQAKAMDSISRARIDDLVSRCPYREKRGTRDRFLWSLDGNRPQEGERCIWVELNTNGKIVGCGLVFLG